MKKILYFILAVLTIIYVFFLCYYNIAGSASVALKYVAIYGGLIIALTYAIINFIGNPLKVVFFILLGISILLLVLTIAIPGIFRSIFGITCVLI